MEPVENREAATRIDSAQGGASRSRNARPGLAIAAAAVVAAAGGFLLLRSAERQVQAYEGPVRHVIVISLDTTRADHLGCYGNAWIRTPCLDALATESIVFMDYMTVVPTTLASHTSLFTGKHPHTHGTPRNGFMVNDENEMLAEILSDVGFDTAGVLGSFALDSRFNFAQGFDSYDETFDQVVGDSGADQDQRSAAAVTDAAIAHLERRGVSPNLFLFVHYFDPHLPYAPPPPCNTMYGPTAGAAAPDVKHVRQQLPGTGGSENAAAVALARLYAGEVSYMDEHVGRLIDYLRRRGILDDAILIITSDHGENFWEHQLCFNHGLSTYQTTLHAVCMIRLPNAERGRTRIDAPIASIDILPTLLEYLGLPIPDDIDGEVIDLADGAQPPVSRARFAEATKPWDEVETDPRWFNARKTRCVRQGDWKYVCTPYRQTEELYDLSVDPFERHNLLATPTPTPKIAAKAKELRRKLDAWAESADPLPSRFEPSQYLETIQRLRSLGYLGSG